MDKSGMIACLQSGGIGVMPTDTIYGLVGKADNAETINRIYEVRQRRPDKPLIILISRLEDLDRFKIDLSNDDLKLIKQLWPGEVSIILPCPAPEFEYLHRGTGTLAFRLPASESIRDIVAQTGPLVAPSANPEGQPPAADLAAAKEYFGDQIDFYYGQGELKSAPSTLVSIAEGKIKILRQGQAEISIK